MLTQLPKAKALVKDWLLCLDDESIQKEKERKKYFSFLTTQERNNFPTGQAHDRMGASIKMIKGQPNTGPGTYHNHDYNTIKTNSDRWMTSKLGYTCSARTAPRIAKQHQEKTPDPSHYQRNTTLPKLKPPNMYGFNCTQERFNAEDVHGPGPGTYDHEFKVNRKVIWPEQFGKPIFPIEPNLPQRSLKTELLVDKEYRKFKNKVAYFRLYY